MLPEWLRRSGHAQESHRTWRDCNVAIEGDCLRFLSRLLLFMANLEEAKRCVVEAIEILEKLPSVRNWQCVRGASIFTCWLMI
jgi:hypothetical protein